MVSFRLSAAALMATGLLLVQPSVQAEHGYPARPIKLIVPHAAGGTVDVFARLIAPGLSEKLKQPVVVENISGAGGVVGVSRGAKSPADGYSLFIGIVSDVILAPLTETTTAYTYEDMEPVAPLGTSGLAIVANPALGIDSFPALISYAKAHPGKLSYGAAGAGSLPDLAMESLKHKAGLHMAFIPYASSSKIVLDVIGGHVDLGVSGLPALLEHIKTDKVTAIGVLSKERDIGAPGIAAVGETAELGDMDFFFWTGLFALKARHQRLSPKSIWHSTTSWQRLRWQPASKNTESNSASRCRAQSFLVMWLKAIPIGLRSSTRLASNASHKRPVRLLRSGQAPLSTRVGLVLVRLSPCSGVRPWLQLNI